MGALVQEMEQVTHTKIKGSIGLNKVLKKSLNLKNLKLEEKVKVLYQRNHLFQLKINTGIKLFIIFLTL